MAAQRGPNSVEKKKARSKKRRTRTEVSSSSESDSDVPSEKAVTAVEQDSSDTSSSSPSSPAPIPARKEKKNKKAKADGASDRKGADEDGDVSMQDAPAAPPQPAKSTTTPKAGGVQQTQDEFSALYLRKIAAEFADDLDKVREAQDFKASSVPMLIHALKQGESLFTPEEKRRVVGAANA